MMEEPLVDGQENSPIPYKCPKCGNLSRIRVEWRTTQTISTDILTRAITIHGGTIVRNLANCPECGHEWGY